MAEPASRLLFCQTSTCLVDFCYECSRSFIFIYWFSYDICCVDVVDVQGQLQINLSTFCVSALMELCPIAVFAVASAAYVSTLLLIAFLVASSCSLFHVHSFSLPLMLPLPSSQSTASGLRLPQQSLAQYYPPRCHHRCRRDCQVAATIAAAIHITNVACLLNLIICMNHNVICGSTRQ